MDGGNGAVKVVWYLRVPDPLNRIVEDYQRSRQIASKQQAICELLETHPEIARRAAMMYAGMDSKPT